MARTFRLSLVAATFFVASCTTSPAPVAPPIPTGPYGLTPEEEATILRLEDRREFDRQLSDQWASHPNELHRLRIALALGRIATATFDDRDGDGEKDPQETMAGVDILTRLGGDGSAEVRRTAAFSLGETGDPAAVGALIRLANDPEHADVAAEAVESLSKVAAHVPLEAYAALTRSEVRPAIRARALRFLFRFDNDAASALAASLLDDPSVDIRREAVYTLARRKYAPARARLELFRTDPDTLSRAYAVRALGRIAAAESYAPLVAMLADSHPWVRTNAAFALVALHDADKAAFRKATTTDDVVRVITTTEDLDGGTRISAIELLGVYATFNEQARVRLLELAVNAARPERESAIAAFAAHFGNTQTGTLQSFMQTDDAWIKRRIITATAESPQAFAIVRNEFANDSDPGVRASVVGAVSDEQAAAEIDLIRRSVSDRDLLVRATAIGRLAAAISDPQQLYSELMTAWSATTNDRDNDARMSIVAAVSKLDVPQRADFLRARLADTDPVIRRAAADAIELELRHPRPQFTPLPIDRPLAEYVNIVHWSRGRHVAVIETERGNIEVTLVSQDAPMTAHNFATLAQRGYFNGTSFMRVVPNFVIQGGDPRNDGTGGPGYSIRDEMNLQKYTRAAVGMALSGPDTGGSQFFVTHSPQHHLDGGYTIFGRVTRGMEEVVDRIQRGDVVRTVRIVASP